MAGSRFTVVLEKWNVRRGLFARLADVARGAQRAALRRVFRRAVTVAAEESPVGKGEGRGPRFRDAWAVETTDTHGGAEGELINRARHAPYVIYPTRPHIIRARRARALRFSAGGAVLYRRQVFHPGTKGNPVAMRTLRRIAPALDAELRAASAEVQTAIVDIFK